MRYKVLYTFNFKKELKRLSKKHHSLKDDIELLITDLEENPIQGKPLGKDCYKTRMAITSKGKGKRTGARVITCVKIIKTTVYLLTIFDKSEKEDLTDKELKELLSYIE